VPARHAIEERFDDRAETQFTHLWTNRLRREEVMAEVDVLGMVPISDADVVDRVPFIAGGVVDQRRNQAERLARPPDRRLQRRNVDHIALEKQRLLAGSCEFLGQSLARVGLQVAEGDARVIAGEGPHDVGADPGCAAADEDGAAGKARIGREGQAVACGMRDCV
jgi:hypothetical protein